MQVGSRVVYIGGEVVSAPFVVGNEYTVSCIDKCTKSGKLLITVYEVDLGVCPFTGESIGVAAKYFREVEPKHELSDITAEELIKELEVIPQTV